MVVVPVGGGEPKPVAAVECSAIVNDATYAYCATASAPHYLVRLALDGSGEPTNLLPLEGKATALALDGTTLYWAEDLTRAIQAMSLEDGSPRLVAEDVPVVGAMTFDTDNLYVTSFDEGSKLTSLLQVSKLEGTAPPLLTTDREIRAIAVHDEHVWFADPGAYAMGGYIKYSGSTSKVGINQTSVANERQYIVSGLHHPHGLTVDATGVFVSSGVNGALVRYAAVAAIAGGKKCQAKWHCNPCDESCMLGHATSCVNLGCAFEITVPSVDATTCNVKCVNPGRSSGATTL